MTMLTWEQIDEAVDAFLASDPAWDHSKAQDFADFWGVTRNEASLGLGYHLKVQESGRAKHTIVCRGYGRAALWFLASRDGSRAAQYRHIAEGHVAHIARDAANRVVTDALREVDPAMLASMNPAQRRVVRNATDNFIATVTSAAQQCITVVEALAGADTRNMAEEKVY